MGDAAQRALHIRDITDFFAGVTSGNLPAVSKRIKIAATAARVIFSCVFDPAIRLLQHLVEPMHRVAGVGILEKPWAGQLEWPIRQPGVVRDPRVGSPACHRGSGRSRGKQRKIGCRSTAPERVEARVEAVSKRTNFDTRARSWGSVSRAVTKWPRVLLEQSSARSAGRSVCGQIFETSVKHLTLPWLNLQAHFRFRTVNGN